MKWSLSSISLQNWQVGVFDILNLCNCTPFGIRLLQNLKRVDFCSGESPLSLIFCHVWPQSAAGQCSSVGVDSREKVPKEGSLTWVIAHWVLVSIIYISQPR